MRKLLAVVPSAIDCTDPAQGFDVAESFARMARLRGRGGEADFERCVEMRRAKELMKPRKWVALYLPHASVDVKKRKALYMVEIARMPGGRELCATFGLTKTLQLNRIKDQEQRTDFVTQYPPESFTVEQLRGLIDGVLGHHPTPRKVVPRGDYNRAVWAAGNLHIDPTNFDEETIRQHYTLLASAFSTRPELRPFLTRLDAAMALLTPTASSEPA